MLYYYLWWEGVKAWVGNKVWGPESYSRQTQVSIPVEKVKLCGAETFHIATHKTVYNVHVKICILSRPGFDPGTSGL